MKYNQYYNKEVMNLKELKIYKESTNWGVIKLLRKLLKDTK